MVAVLPRVIGMSGRFLAVGFVSCRFNSTRCFKMPAEKDIASSSAAGQGGISGRTISSPVRPYLGKPIELLNE